MVGVEVHFFFLKYLKNAWEQHLILVMVVWKHCVKIFSMENTARKDAFCRFWSSGHIPAIQSPVLRGKVVRGTTNIPNTYWRFCSLGMRQRLFNPIFNDYLPFQEEILKTLRRLRPFEDHKFSKVAEGKQGDAELTQSTFWLWKMSKLCICFSFPDLDCSRGDSSHVLL